MFARFQSSVKRHFLTGLVVFVPVALTIFLVEWLDSALLAKIALIPKEYNPLGFVEGRIPGLGVILSLIIIYIIGFISSNYLGRLVVRLYEKLLGQIPGVRWLYGVSKQLMNAVFKLLEELQGKGTENFKGVVMIEYPRKGAYTIAFVTGEPVREAEEKIGRPVVNVFVPTTPNPTSGFFLMVPKDEVIPMEMGVEQALRLVLSAGMVGAEEVAPKKTKARSGEERALETA